MNTSERDTANAIVRRAIDEVIAQGREVGVQVAAYCGGKLAIDTWGGLADPVTERRVDGETLFNVNGTDLRFYA